MSTWASSSTTDRIVKLGKAWVRVSAVTAVEPASATEGSLVHCGTSSKRILVTGSRDWTDGYTIVSALASIREELGGNCILIEGGCPTGADRIARDNWFGRHETFPADWAKYGKRAGFIRNAAMVHAGADVCLAFIKNRSRGATMTADLAENAGIPVRQFIQDTNEGNEQ